MSEVVESGMTAGGLLKEARQAAGMHIAALAVVLKVPVSKLEALEANDYTFLPDRVFVRALASSVCRTLRVDPAPILALLPQSQSPHLSLDSAGINAPLKGKGDAGKLPAVPFIGARSGSRSVVIWIIPLLLLAALVLFFAPRHSASVVSGDAVSEDLSASASESAVADVPSIMDHSVEVSSSALSVAPLAASASPAAFSGSSAVSLPLPASVASGVATSNATAADGAAGASAGPLVLRARSASWVQVRDANGVLALQRNLAAGETVSVSGPTPLAVIVGRADATEVTVRGKPFDLTAVARENVARFEVK